MYGAHFRRRRLRACLLGIASPCALQSTKSVYSVAALSRRVRTHSNAGNVPVVVHKAPLMADQIQSEYMVVYFIGVLVKASKGVDLVVAAVGN